MPVTKLNLTNDDLILIKKKQNEFDRKPNKIVEVK